MANPKDYEVYCVETIITHLSTQFPTSKRYCETAVRKFLRNEETLAFKNAEKALRNSNWEALDVGKYIFEEIEVDCLLHIYDTYSPSAVNFTPPFYHVKPTSTWQSNHPSVTPKNFEKKISDKAIVDINDAPNAYAVFEISIDANIFDKKLGQLERDLTVLLYRQRLNDDNIHIEDIVRFVGLATTKADLVKIRQFIETEESKLPLLSTLYTLNRVLVVKVRPDLSYTSRKLAQFNSYSDIISSISDIDEKIKIQQLRKANADAEKAILEKHLLEKTVASSCRPSFTSMEEFYTKLRKEVDYPDAIDTFVKPAFNAQLIGTRQLSDLTDTDVQEYGITQGGLRKAILKVLGK
jgi:hypothetical protein